MKTNALYISECRHQKIGQHCEAQFQSFDQAKAAPLPEGFTFAFIRSAEASAVYDPIFKWRDLPVTSL